jgi:hypothetical protein
MEHVDVVDVSYRYSYDLWIEFTDTSAQHAVGIAGDKTQIKDSHLVAGFLRGTGNITKPQRGSGQEVHLSITVDKQDAQCPAPLSYTHTQRSIATATQYRSIDLT